MKGSEVTFYSHCDDPSCDLGSADFTCPMCERPVSEYGDLWWERYDHKDGDRILFRCGRCGTDLVATYDGEERDWYVKANGGRV